MLAFVWTVVGWVTPMNQMNELVNNKDYPGWESLRNGLTRKWTNLNIVCGLIMGAISTILFSDLSLSEGAFVLGIITLLSSLIAIGFGVGLLYVLADVKGNTLNAICARHPHIFLLALSIPQTWAAISGCSFLAHVSVFGWQAADKGPVVKIGIMGTIVVLSGHLVAFAFLLRTQNSPDYFSPALGRITNSAAVSSPVSAKGTVPPLQVPRS